MTDTPTTDPIKLPVTSWNSSSVSTDTRPACASTSTPTTRPVERISSFDNKDLANPTILAKRPSARSRTIDRNRLSTASPDNNGQQPGTRSAPLLDLEASAGEGVEVDEEHPLVVAGLSDEPASNGETV